MSMNAVPADRHDAFAMLSKPARIERVRIVTITGKPPCQCHSTYLPELGAILVEHDARCTSYYSSLDDYEPMLDEHAEARQQRESATTQDGECDALPMGRVFPVDRQAIDDALEAADLTGAAFMGIDQRTYAGKPLPGAARKESHADIVARCARDLNVAILAASRAGLDVRCTYEAHHLVTGEVTLIDTVQLVRSAGAHAGLARAAIARVEEG